MPDAHVNGVRLYYEEHGTGLPILGIHGTSSSAMAWRGAVDALSALGRVIVYDRRGCTRSERPDPFETSIGQHADDAAALITELGASPALVIGRSYGGVVALELAVRAPDLVRGLVLLEPAPVVADEEVAAWDRALGATIEAAAAEDPGSVGETFLRTILGDEGWAALPARAQETVIENSPAILAELRGGWLEATPEELGRIETPVLLVSAADSPEALRRVALQTRDLIPESDIAFVEGGHLIDPSEPAVLDFVRSLPA
jgi:pimeloyl-ACP methyl ester carboxylesterase